MSETRTPNEVGTEIGVDPKRIRDANPSDGAVR